MTGKELIGTIKTNNHNARTALASAPPCGKDAVCAEHGFRGLAFEYGLGNSEAIAEFLGNGLTEEIKSAVADGLRDCHESILKPEIASAVRESVRQAVPGLGVGGDRSVPTIKWGKLTISGMRSRDMLRLIEFALLVAIALSCVYFVVRGNKVDEESVATKVSEQVERQVEAIMGVMP